MAWQLIYTSAQRTLTPGQCGYGTVARSADLRESLVQRLEQLSYYDIPAATAPSGACPVIHAHRLLDVRGSKYHLLSRTVDARLDFTNRTNHLSHHIVLNPGELADLPSPATLLRHWDGWRDVWSEEPRFLDESDWGNLRQLPRSVPLPAATWAQLTGDAGRAAALVDGSAPGGIQLLVRPDQELVLLDLFAESLQLLDVENRAPGRRWQFAFTTLLQNRDNPADFHWRGCRVASDVHSASQRPAGAALIPPADLPVPETPRATAARRGPGIVPGRPSPPSGSTRPEPPSNGPSAPLRLNRSNTSGDESPSGTRREAPAARAPCPTAPPPRVLTRRVFIPLSALLVLAFVLLGGFYKPGWFLDRRNRDAPVSAAPIPLLPDSAPVVTGLPTGPMSPESPGLTPARIPEVSANERAQLEAAVDRIPTYLIHARTPNPAVELGPIPELEALLRRVFGGAPALGKEHIRVLIHLGDIQLAIAKPMTERQPTVDEFGKKELLVASPSASGSPTSLDCSEWLKPQPSPIRLSGFPPVGRGLSLVFQPVDGNPGFDPFRLLLITGQPPKPIELGKGLLRSGRTHFEHALDPDFLSRLPRLPVPPAVPLRFQLRAYAGSPATELFEPFSADYQPTEGSELAMDLHRQNVQALIDDLTREQERIRASAEGWKAEMRASVTNDVALGTLLGIGKSTNVSHLASLEDFIKRKGVSDLPDRNDFVEYLRALFLHLRIPARDLPAPPRYPTVKELAQLPKSFADALTGKPDLQKAIPQPSYFTNRWAQLGTMELLRTVEDENLIRSNRVVRLNALLARIPPDLDATPRISLNVVDAKGARLFELIRFTDPAPKGAP